MIIVKIAGNEIEMEETVYNEYKNDMESLTKGQFITKWRYLWE